MSADEAYDAGSPQLVNVRAGQGGYRECHIYTEHGACSCSTGVPGNECPLVDEEPRHPGDEFDPMERVGWPSSDLELPGMWERADFTGGDDD